MYVLMDMEWYERQNAQIPTQLAAMRVDDELAYDGMFYSRINPSCTGKINWSNIAFNGGTKSEFRNAYPLESVLCELEKWLKDDDILLWWHESGADFFKRLCECNALASYKMGVIHRIVQKKLNIPGNKHGGTYELAKAMDIQIPDTEHYAPNDVAVLQRLLSQCCLPPSSLIEAGCCEWVPYVKPDTAVHTIMPKEKKMPAQPQQTASEFKFYHDLNTGLFHKAGCCKCTQDSTKLQGFLTLKGCLRRNLNPCECCQSETDQYLTQTGKNKLWLKYSVYSKQKLVHFPGCKVLGRIKPQNICAFKTIEESQNAGFCLCSACNPMLAQYEKEKGKIDHFCRINRLNFTMKDGIAYIISKHDFWRIMLGSDNGRPVLYHRSAVIFRKQAENQTLPMYHRQNSNSNTLMGHLKYIVNHDAYRDRLLAAEQRQKKKNPTDTLPCTHSKKGKRLAKQQKDKNKRKAVSRVLALIEELEAARI